MLVVQLCLVRVNATFATPELEKRSVILFEIHSNQSQRRYAMRWDHRSFDGGYPRRTTRINIFVKCREGK